MTWTLSLSSKHNGNNMAASKQRQYKLYKRITGSSQSSPPPSQHRTTPTIQIADSSSTTADMPPLNDFYRVEPGRPYIHYDSPGDKELPIVVDDLVGGTVIFLRGQNTHYNYGRGCTYRIGAAIKDHTNIPAEVRAIVKLAGDLGSFPPDQIWVLASSQIAGLAAWQRIVDRLEEKQWRLMDAEERIIIYGDEDARPPADRRKDIPKEEIKDMIKGTIFYKTNGVWKASLSFDKDTEPTIIRTKQSRKE